MIAPNFEINTVDVEKPLRWYKNLTTVYVNFLKDKIKLAQLEKDIKYYSNEIELSYLPNAIEKYSNRWLHILRWHEKLINERNQIIRDQEQNNDWFKDDLYYIPSLLEWEDLTLLRPKILNENIQIFLNESKRMPAKDIDLADSVIKNIYDFTFQSNFYDIISKGPLLKQMAESIAEYVVDEKKQMLSGWEYFCCWIYKIDFGKWLFEKAYGSQNNRDGLIKLNNTNSDVDFRNYGKWLIDKKYTWESNKANIKGEKPTYEMIIQFYHYLSKYIAGYNLSDKAFAEKIATKYSLDVNTLKRTNTNFDKKGITHMGDYHGSTRNVKLKRIKFVISEIKKIIESEALNAELSILLNKALNDAVKDSKIINQKIIEWEKNKK